MSPLERLMLFENRWRASGPRTPGPDWSEFLPDPIEGELVELIIQMDIEFRIKLGRPRIRVEDYFIHERLDNWSPTEASIAACLAWEQRLRLRELSRSLDGGHDRDGEPCLNVPGYQIRDLIAEGGMGAVYLATQSGLNRLVALKLVNGRHQANPTELVRFLAEAEAIAAIDHPNVVRVIEFGDAHGSPFLAMEYLPGGTLTKKLKAGPLPPREAAEMVRKLALAAQAAHDLQIVHRDIKPGNVLFDAQGEPHLTDFGLAKICQGADLTNTRAIVGTPAYMAPEQARGGARFVGPCADVYSLGVILFESLSGRRPYDDPDPILLLRKVAEEDVPSIRSHIQTLPRELELVVRKCLSKEPVERYPSAAALGEDLRRWLAGEPLSVKPMGWVERLLRWMSRNRRAARIILFSIFGTLLVLFIANIVLWWLLRREWSDVY